ncbi:MBL fold metallo-hydrolase [Clostridium taeniosporum]|uniref:MBL fold metallo-hydrolase n=1 Tax=Clostridium taeniosporum TaxID=394958 RepID=A0A1D7XM32_9CLOT|nr:MBL fold metallo-hydrolase [Clostridium taeniosporum]AOR24159.1 MBL fold metallo-hydrolase [Clostridium taeniosporum]
MDLRITTLIENNPDKDNLLLSEHGLSLYLEIDKIKVLFDTGKSGDFIKNAEKLKINLNDLDYVILSHGHYDHSGGFKSLVENTNKSFDLIVGNGFFNKKYKLLEEDKYKFNGNSFDEKFIDKNNISIRYVNNDLFKITKDIIFFSNFEKNTDFEMINKKFYIKKDNQYVKDDFLDEIVLAVKHEKGLIVVLGCSHIGVVNILKTIIKRTNMPIYAVIGGSHLIEADELRLNNTIEFFKENNIKLLALSHCTGENAIKKFQYEFGNNFIYNNTGNVIEII